ncbi:MAG TPA: hypothetical protein VFX59_13245, partial [Polyangiales bacterium]|nr:hypothetical protein [Polyangiales bacterium]
DQPSTPSQECDVLKLDEDVFTLSCHDQDWQISGTAVGLQGAGLRLALYDDKLDDDETNAEAAHSQVDVVSAGKFVFPRELSDDVNWRVAVVQQPTSPRQDCTVTNGEGFASDADYRDVHVECVTRQYTFGSVVVGLKGTGLVIEGNGGQRITLTPGEFLDSALFPDGLEFEVKIVQQPTSPAQLCVIQNGKGKIDGANWIFTVVCDAAGNLRISEVGSCPFSNSSCWFEVINIGAMPEQLSFYKFRTSALSPTGFTPSRVFAMPQITIPQFSTVIVQGKVPGSMADGSGVFHVADGPLVPWWGSDGFLELLNPSGATTSFIRWGSNTIEPTTGGTYAGGAAPALPKGAAAYGYSLQHVFEVVPGTPTGSSFKLRAFSTYGGPNDLTADADADADGIPDSAEIPGGTIAGLSMYAYGARTGRKDIFVEIDRMAGEDPATLPRKEALDKVVQAFERKNIFVHFDVGDLYSKVVDPAAYNLGGGNEVPFASAVALAPKDSAIKNFYDIKAANMAANRRMVFYYQLFAWSQQKDGSGGSSGVGELPGNDSIVTLGGFGLMGNTLAQRNVITNYQAASIMHELGHNFGLRHGGSDSLNMKPNYVSVMNYLYSPLGLATIGNNEGDRYDFYKRCSLSSVTQLTNSPSGDVSRFVIDFSSGQSANLDENALREASGLGRVGSQQVDYNCNKKTETTAYSRDLNSDGALDVLADHDDWNGLDFVFRRYAEGAENGPSLRPADERYDTLTADHQHNTDQACPPLFAPTDL